MSVFHRFKQYLKYRIKAKSRHGVHSPFVYDFAEKVLRDKSDKNLEARIIDYFGHSQILFLERNRLAEFERLHPKLNSQSVVIIRSIHESKTQTIEWEKIHSQPEVRLSIDLFKIGLLFFRDDFKVKQHFILKT